MVKGMGFYVCVGVWGRRDRSPSGLMCVCVGVVTLGTRTCVCVCMCVCGEERFGHPQDLCTCVCVWGHPRDLCVCVYVCVERIGHPRDLELMVLSPDSRFVVK